MDGLGNPLRLLLSPGNRNDICYAQKLLEPFDLRGKFVIADRGYDSDKFVRWLEERGTVVVIPSRRIGEPRKICVKRNKTHPFSQGFGIGNQTRLKGCNF